MTEIEAGRCSVIIPAYNVEGFVGEAIESALDQTYGDVEVVVINDGSNDATADRIRPFMEHIVYLEQDNQGLSAARNTGIRNSTGEIIGLLDADDLWAPERVARCVNLLREQSDVGFVTTDAFLIYERTVSTDRFFGSKKPFPTKEFPQEIVRRNFMFVAVFARRSLYDQVGLFDESLRAVEDYDMWLRFISEGAQPALIDEPLAYYRMREGSLTTDRTHIADSLYAVLEKRLPSYWEMNIFGNAQEAWTIGQRALARGDRQQARRFFVAASRDTQKTALQQARIRLAAARQTFSVRRA